MIQRQSLLHPAMNILIADDDEGDRRLIKRALRQTSMQVAWVETGNITEALQACETCSFDCAIVDYLLPGQNGLTGLTALHQRLPNMAILMVTGQGDELIATEAMKRGAADYIPKSSISAESIRKSIESAVEKASLHKLVVQQRSELEVFSRLLVHDLSSPIHSSVGFASLIEEKILEGDAEAAVAICRRLLKSLHYVDDLIDTLHRYASADEIVELQPLEMRDVMANALSNLEHIVSKRSARVTYGDLPLVAGTAQLTQLLQNLIGNAIKYCDAAVPTVHVSAALQDGNVWLFSVKDNGIGIPEADCEQVFEPFHRLHSDGKYEGTGLGLATCKKIVDRHGGSIFCKSNSDQGSTFFFTLPAVSVSA